MLNPSNTVDTVKEDFKLDNFTLRGAMKIFKLSRRLFEAFEATFLLLVWKKNYAKTIVEKSRPDISSVLYAKLLTYQPTSASVEWSFSELKSMIYENRNFDDE